MSGISVIAADGGNGTAAAPYRISSYADFTEIRHNPSASYILTEDIAIYNSLDDVDFAGTLDGNGHIISDGHTNEPLFGTISGTVKNPGLITRVDTKGDAGALARQLTGNVSNTEISGSIEVGSSEDAAANIGGIAGIISGGTVNNTKINVSISGYGATAGGIVGKLINAKINSCYSDSGITKSAVTAEAIAGIAENSTLSACYYNRDKNSWITSGIGIVTDTTAGIATADMKNASSYSFDFANTWTTVGDSVSPMLTAIYGKGTQGEPYKIHSKNDFNTFLAAYSKDANKYYKLASDITVSYSQSDSFAGHFDGAGYVITLTDRQSQYLESGTDAAYGLFPEILEGAFVENIVMEQGTSIGKYKVSTASGSITAVNKGTINNCHVHSSYNTLTRAEAATIIERVMRLYKGTDK